jgi:hypothetical protein
VTAEPICTTVDGDNDRLDDQVIAQFFAELSRAEQKQEVICYIKDMAGGLQKMAQESSLESLAVLLELVVQQSGKELYRYRVPR